MHVFFDECVRKREDERGNENRRVDREERKERGEYPRAPFRFARERMPRADERARDGAPCEYDKTVVRGEQKCAWQKNGADEKLEQEKRRQAEPNAFQCG